MHRGRLTFRGNPGALHATSDTFVIAEEETVTDLGRPALGTDPLCARNRDAPADCIVLDFQSETPRRMPYPRREVSRAREAGPPGSSGER